MSMKVYTSYYTKVNRCKIKDRLVLVQVSNTRPQWWEGRIHDLGKLLAPDWSLINAYKNGTITYEAFCEEYKADLSRRVEPTDVVDKLEEIARECGLELVVLLCWEKEGCHRFALAEWLEPYCNVVGEIEL